MYPKYIINKRPEFENLWLFDGLDSSIVIIAKNRTKMAKTMHRSIVIIKHLTGALRRHRFYNLSWEHRKRESLETQES